MEANSIGAFGIVKKASHKKTGMVRAVKILKKSNLSEDEQKTVMNEVEVLKSLVKKILMPNRKMIGSSKYYKDCRNLRRQEVLLYCY